MKISLNWVFDHIKGELSRIDVAQLVDTFIKTTAEIEGWKKVTFNTDELTLAEVVAIEDDSMTVYSVERNKKYVLPLRADAAVGALFMIADLGNMQKWATTIMFGGTKDVVCRLLM